MKIAIFGGTFDPPHLGHVNIVEELLGSKVVDKIIILVAYKPPHKTEQKVSNFNERCEMLNLAFKDLIDSNNKVEISRIEEERSGQLSYTFDTLELLQKKYLNDKIYLLIGSDSLMQLHLWYKAEVIAKNYTIITYPRPDYQIDATKLEKYWNKLMIAKFEAHIVDFSVKLCASSEIRGKISKNDDVSSLLSSEVLCYIKDKELY